MKQIPIATRILIAVFLSLLTVALMWPQWQHLTHIMTTSVSYEHTLYAPLLTLVLLGSRWQQMKRLRPLPAPVSDNLGVVALAAVLVLLVLSELTTLAFLGHGAAVAGLWAVVLLMFGRAYFGFFAYALASLAFIIPFGEYLIPKLQIMSAAGAVNMLSLLGFDAQSDGVFMILSGGTYEIVRACAGLHFLTTSIMLGYFLSSLLFESMKDRLKILLLAALIPLAVNIMRVMTIVIIAEVYDFGFAISTDHMIYGWVFLTIISLLLIMITYRMAPKNPPVQRPKARSAHAPSQRPIVGFLVLIALAFLGAHAIKQAEILPSSPPSPSLTASDWRPINTARLRWQPRFQGADYQFQASYRRGGSRVEMQVYHYDYQREGAELLAGTNKIGSDDFRQQHDQNQQFQPFPKEHPTRFVEEILLKGRHDQKLVWVIYRVNGRVMESRSAARRQLLLGRLKGVNLPATALICAMSFGPSLGRSGKPAARQALTDFIQVVRLEKVKTNDKEGEP